MAFDNILLISRTHKSYCFSLQANDIYLPAMLMLKDIKVDHVHHSVIVNLWEHYNSVTSAGMFTMVDGDVRINAS